MTDFFETGMHPLFCSVNIFFKQNFYTILFIYKRSVFKTSVFYKVGDKECAGLGKTFKTLIFNLKSLLDMLCVIFF